MLSYNVIFNTFSASEYQPEAFFDELSYVRTTSDSKVSVDLYLLFSFLSFLSQHKGSTGIVKVRWTSEIK